MPCVIKVKNLCKEYKRGSTKFNAVDNVNFEIEEREREHEPEPRGEEYELSFKKICAGAVFGLGVIIACGIEHYEPENAYDEYHREQGKVEVMPLHYTVFGLCSSR